MAVGRSAGKRVEQLRAQGERTRIRLVEVARGEIEKDASVSLTAIARAAGVGIGTLYRHFPTREELVLELYRHDVDKLAAAAEDLLRASAPADALRLWLDKYAQFVMAKAGLVQALRSSSAHMRFAQEAYQPVAAAITSILTAGERTHVFRAGLTADDLLLATDGLYRLDPESDWRPRASRLFELVMAGLRPELPD